MTPPLHDAVAHLAVLLGDWEGEGTGHYPTIADFGYHERVSFGHVGKPFLTYAQRTTHSDDGRPLHAEVGYLRAASGADAGMGIELLLAHPTGIVEVEEGGFDGGTMTLRTTTIGLSATAKPVRSLRRELRIDGDEIAYDVWMAHGDTPETHHLAARLTRVS